MAADLTILSYDPGESTGVVALRVSPEGVKLIWSGVVLQTAPLLIPLPISELSELTDVVVEAEPHRPDNLIGARRAQEILVVAAQQGLRSFAYAPGQWKPMAKRLILRYPGELRTRHARDAYGMAMIHLRRLYARNFPFLLEADKPWYLPVK